MSKYMIPLLILLFPLISLAQRYQSFPTKNTVWTEYFYADRPSSENVYHYFALKDCDTVINGLQYHKLYCSFDTIFTENELCGGLREKDKRIYYYSIRYLDNEILNAPVPLNTEVILYDFNLQPGDTLTNDTFRIRHVNELIVADFDSILIGDKYRKRYNFMTEYGTLYTLEHWVEGVGNLRGLLSDTGAYPTSDWNSWLICMIKGGDVLYHDSQFSNCCNLKQSSIQIESKARMKIFNNPAESSIQVKLGNNNYWKLIISDLSGRQIKQYSLNGIETLTIERDMLPNGFYFLSISDKAGHVQTMKILFE